MSIQTVKGFEIGLGFEAAKRLGSKMHDEIIKDNKGNVVRKTNNAGGIEGGMSNGETILIRAACKPISTLRKPLKTVNLKENKEDVAQYERSDVCVVPAASVVGQAVVSFEIAKAFLEKFGADTFDETKNRYYDFLKNLSSLNISYAKKI